MNQQCNHDLLSLITSFKHLSPYEHLTELNLSNFKLLKIDIFPFEQFSNLHSLDLSYNELTFINPDWSKSYDISIKYLNLSHNKLQTLLFLKDFKSLKTLDVTENLLLNNERYLSLYICPTIEHLIDYNQDQISSDRIKLNQLLLLIERNLNDFQSLSYYDSRQFLIKLIEKEKQFSLFHLSPLGNYFIRKIISHYSQRFITENFNQSINITEKSLFQPLKFFRSHHQSDNNLLTISVHQCAFQPNTTDIIATCGGQKVCFIDCNTCEITHLFEITKKDYFSCLCWIEIEDINILAVGTINGDIYLLSHKWKLMFEHIQLPNSSINCLTWHSNNPFTLVIASYHTIRFINIRSYTHRLQSFIRKQNKPNVKFDYTDSSEFINKIPTTHFYNLYNDNGPLIIINDLLFYPLSNNNNVLLVGTNSGLFIIKRQDKTPIQLAFPKSIRNINQHIKSLCLINTPTRLIGMNILNLDEIYCFDIEQSIKNQQLNLILLLPNPYRQISTKISIFSNNNINGSFEFIIGSNHGSFYYYQIECYKPKQQFEISWAQIESSLPPNILSINLNKHYLCFTTDNNLICIYKRQ